MGDLLSQAKDYAKDIMGFTTTLVFVLSGIYLWIIDGSDLKTKGMMKELKFTRIVAILYIFGAMAAFIVLKLIG